MSIERDPSVLIAKQTRGVVKPRTRSKVSNGALHIGVDLRTTEARRFKDLVREFLQPFPDADEATRSLARRIAGLMIRAEAIEADIASGRPICDDEYVRLSGVLSRLQDKHDALVQERCGKSRRVAPTLDQVKARILSARAAGHVAETVAQQVSVPKPQPQTNIVVQQQLDDEAEGWSKEDQELVDLVT